MKVRKDLRSAFGQIRDQGRRPTCLAFAVSDAHAASREKDWLPLSCEYLFYQAVKLQGSSPDRGISIVAARDVLRNTGQPREHAWPYLDDLPADRSAWKPPVEIRDIWTHDSVRIAPSFMGIWNSVDRGIPVVIGLTISMAFFNPGSPAIINSDEPVEAAVRHAVIAVGTGSLEQDRMLLVRNSWGEEWGASGHAWLTEEYLAIRVLDAFSLKEI